MDKMTLLPPSGYGETLIIVFEAKSEMKG